MTDPGFSWPVTDHDAGGGTPGVLDLIGKTVDEDFILVSSPSTVLTINRPKSWLARAIWRFMGVTWEKNE